ncbi:hypothetical protein [Umezakia ovalisporum]|uniref:hypothetical protein n=1 Tax=Umezakia ovalisporum TaxID=75695 RepID=UPI0006EEBD78|nr:hypothetical protein [Umezakia ovalisporum]MBI1241991.1 hypothetical protein [Nostoc sp. RI_552]MDH6085069.1 hypothetical protein [Umezakia ovalisporum TAC611]MDH6088426.1 hypothetical protein [Umezakia ovalisporum Ak1311]CEJ45859.1 Uncharacterized protein apha_02187 [Umezakia ovalisporum]
MPRSQMFTTSFNFQEVYPCPVCGVGQVSHMPMMETMACDFCHEIFTVNLEQQQIKMPSRQPPLIWRWNGFTWTEPQLEGVELGWGYGLAAIAFVVLPTTVVGLAAYYLLPISDDPITWLPYIWTVLTFLLHLSIILWIVVEIYQFPVVAYLRAINGWRHRMMER